MKGLYFSCVVLCSIFALHLLSSPAISATDSSAQVKPASGGILTPMNMKCTGPATIDTANVSKVPINCGLLSGVFGGGVTNAAYLYLTSPGVGTGDTVTCPTDTVAYAIERSGGCVYWSCTDGWGISSTCSYCLPIVCLVNCAPALNPESNCTWQQ